MNKEDIITMAREAGLDSISLSFGNEVLAELDTLKEFAALVAAKASAAEREACAKVCDGIRYEGYVPPEDGAAANYYNEASMECASTIRARSNT